MDSIPDNVKQLLETETKTIEKKTEIAADIVAHLHPSDTIAILDSISIGAETAMRDDATDAQQIAGIVCAFAELGMQIAIYRAAKQKADRILNERN